MCPNHDHYHPGRSLRKIRPFELGFEVTVFLKWLIWGLSKSRFKKSHLEASKAKEALESASTPPDLIEAQIAFRKAKARYEATLPKS